MSFYIDVVQKGFFESQKLMKWVHHWAEIFKSNVTRVTIYDTMYLLNLSWILTISATSLISRMLMADESGHFDCNTNLPSYQSRVMRYPIIF